MWYEWKEDLCSDNRSCQSLHYWAALRISVEDFFSYAVIAQKMRIACWYVDDFLWLVTSWNSIFYLQKKVPSRLDLLTQDEDFMMKKICQSSPRIFFILQSRIIFFVSSYCIFIFCYLAFSTLVWPHGFFPYFLMLERSSKAPRDEQNLNKIIRGWSQLKMLQKNFKLATDAFNNSKKIYIVWHRMTCQSTNKCLRVTAFPSIKSIEQFFPSFVCSILAIYTLFIHFICSHL